MTFCEDICEDTLVRTFQKPTCPLKLCANAYTASVLLDNGVLALRDSITSENGAPAAPGFLHRSHNNSPMLTTLRSR